LCVGRLSNQYFQLGALSRGPLFIEATTETGVSNDRNGAESGQSAFGMIGLKSRPFASSMAWIWAWRGYGSAVTLPDLTTVPVHSLARPMRWPIRCANGGALFPEHSPFPDAARAPSPTGCREAERSVANSLLFSGPKIRRWERVIAAFGCRARRTCCASPRGDELSLVGADALSLAKGQRRSPDRTNGRAWHPP